MEPRYDPHGVEERWQGTWEAEGLYDADPDPARTPFVDAHPPPNVTGELHTGHALSRVPVRRERLGRDLQVQLHRRARRLGGDRVEVGHQVLGCGRERVTTGDVEPDRLAAVGEHLLVQQVVAVVRGDRVFGEVALGERGQDPDHGELGAVILGLGPGHRQLVEQLVLDVAPLLAGQRPRGQVELEVPATQLRLELR